MSKENKTTTNEVKKNLTSKRNFILDGKIGEANIKDIIYGIIDVNNFDLEQKEIDESYIAKPINVIINTYGGSLYDSNALIGVIESSETPVHTYCYGKAMSGGFYIFASGHKRFATLLATFMYHDGSVGMHDTISGLQYNLEHYTELRDRYDEYMLSVTNLPKNIMDEKKRIKEDWYMFADEALRYGLVDEIIPFRKRK